MEAPNSAPSTTEVLAVVRGSGIGRDAAVAREGRGVSVVGTLEVILAVDARERPKHIRRTVTEREQCNPGDLR